MENPNIIHVPKNRDGAIILNINPCSICNTSWSTYNGKEFKSCYDTCEYPRKYHEKLAKVLRKGMMNKLTLIVIFVTAIATWNIFKLLDCFGFFENKEKEEDGIDRY